MQQVSPVTSSSAAYFQSDSSAEPCVPSVSAEGKLVSAAAAETFLEELLELRVEDGVDDGVEGAVDVAQPGDGAHQAGGDVARQAQGSRRVDHEERSPAEQEAACKKTRRWRFRTLDSDFVFYTK